MRCHHFADRPIVAAPSPNHMAGSSTPTNGIPRHHRHPAAIPALTREVMSDGILVLNLFTVHAPPAATSPAAPTAAPSASSVCSASTAAVEPVAATAAAALIGT